MLANMASYVFLSGDKLRTLSGIAELDKVLARFKNRSDLSQLARLFRSFMHKEGADLLERLVQEKLEVIAQRQSWLVTYKSNGACHRGVECKGTVSSWRTACGWRFTAAAAETTCVPLDIDLVRERLTCTRCKGSKVGLPVDPSCDGRDSSDSSGDDL